MWESVVIWKRDRAGKGVRAANPGGAATGEPACLGTRTRRAPVLALLTL